MTEPPDDLLAEGAALWEDVTGRFDLDRHEQMLLREACRCVDQLDELHAVASTSGPLSGGHRGAKVHPAVVEARQQRLALARLLAALRLPESDDEPANRPQRRGAPRGFYSVGGAS